MDYDRGAAVPTEIVEKARCDVPGRWTFGTPVYVWQSVDTGQWHIRPATPVADGDTLIRIDGSTNCHVSRDFVDLGLK